MARTAAGKKRGAVLQQLREEAKLEQEDVAQAIGVSRVTVSRWETGASRVKKHVVRELVTLYMSHGVTPDPEQLAAAEIDIPKGRAAATAGLAPLEYLRAPQQTRAGALDQLSRPAPDLTAAAIIPTPELAGYAKAILHMLQNVVSSQQQLVTSLERFVDSESPQHP